MILWLSKCCWIPNLYHGHLGKPMGPCRQQPLEGHILSIPILRVLLKTQPSTQTSPHAVKYCALTSFFGLLSNNEHKADFF